jgi:hypothetical protein
MNTTHNSIEKRWREFSLFEQLGNIGSEVGRASKWQGKDEKIFWGTVERALELFDLTLTDSRWGKQVSEIGRAKEVFCDAVLGGDLYGSTLSGLESYFNNFALSASRTK